MSEDEIVDRLYDENGQVREAVQRSVEDAIKRYPNFDAEWWAGGVAAIAAVLKALGIDRDAIYERRWESDPTRGNKSPGEDDEMGVEYGPDDVADGRPF